MPVPTRASLARRHSPRALGSTSNIIRMNSVAITAKPQGAEAGASRRRGSRVWAYFLLLPLVVLAGLLVYVFMRSPTVAVQVQSTVTPDDMRAIRAEAGRAHRSEQRGCWRELGYSLTHLRPKAFWYHVSIMRSLASCRLGTIQAFGDNALVTYRGRDWGGKRVTIEWQLHKSGGEWSCKAVDHEGSWPDIPTGVYSARPSRPRGLSR